MDRHMHLKHVPTQIPNISLVDQYMWPEKDSTIHHPHDNGISHPIYDCKGWIHYSLPLEMYPKVGHLHPQVQHQLNSNQRHYQNRSKDAREGRTSGFYE